MANVPGLRSPYSKVGRLVYFGRMLDKIRLHARGQLPPAYHANLGDSKPGMFDTRCCTFLRVTFAEITRRTLEGGGDEDVLEWAEGKGGRRTDEECLIWNAFLMKRGWRDHADNVQHLRRLAEKEGLSGKGIETHFDFIDFDEGRDPVTPRLWEKV